MSRSGAPDWSRRAALSGGAAVMLAAAAPKADPHMASLEARLRGGRLGVYAINPRSGRTLSHRAAERFPMCSTFKGLLAACVLARVDAGQERLDRMIAYTAADMLAHAPVTGAHLREGRLSVGALCKAAVEVSDNPAANLLLNTVGGPRGLTAWLRRIGDSATRLDRTEPALNAAVAGDPRDTTTMVAMATDYVKLVQGDILRPASRDRFVGWLEATSTGKARLRARLPTGWRAGDKTGTGAHGSTNDVAVFWPPSGGPIFVSAYVTGGAASLAVREGVLAEVGRIVAETLP